MRLVAESGLWTTGPAQRAAPLTAVLEVSGAVLSWTIDDPPDDTATHIAFTDVSRADWLWRVVGETGHVALASALTTHPDGDLELTGVDVVSGRRPRCAGWRWATGCGAGGPPVSATASPDWTGRCSTPRWRC
ncbi:hypothetical protein BZL30_3586 [Mycobacterium kansasii]|uniref:Uncharacterized protein n=1 Tax=Mycobacterium kansasii TaxID=1768 RepID=A0A1V3X911_MYCKA|nr:hypothetical protein BZL30_3586 [Mycobacterium kansasii]